MFKKPQIALANAQPSNRKSLAPWAVGGALLGLSSQSFAVDVAAAITSAFTGANSNLTTAIVGIIGLAALATGVGLVLKFLSK